MGPPVSEITFHLPSAFNLLGGVVAPSWSFHPTSLARVGGSDMHEELRSPKVGAAPSRSGGARRLGGTGGTTEPGGWAAREARHSLAIRRHGRSCEVRPCAAREARQIPTVGRRGRRSGAKPWAAREERGGSAAVPVVMREGQHSRARSVGEA